MGINSFKRYQRDRELLFITQEQDVIFTYWERAVKFPLT